MLGFVVIVAILLFAAIYPTATALIIAAIVVVMTAQHVRDRYGRK